MSKFISKKILIFISIIILFIGNIYFINKSQKLDYEILIGIPIKGENSDTICVNTSKSKPLNNRNEINIIIFSLMNASSIEKPELSKSIPGSTIWSNDSKEGITYYKINLWINENSIIIENENETKTEYKKIDNTYSITNLKK